MEDKLLEIKEKVRDADKVLIGLGECFQYDWEALLQKPRYQEIEKEIADREEHIWIIPFLQKMILKQEEDKRLRDAYEALRVIVDGKDYFIVSLCMDDYIYRYDFQENRIVTPCGGFRNMQCDFNCEHVLSEVPMEVYEQVLQYYQKKLPLDELKEPICEKCGRKLRFNQLGVTRYAEEGYLDQWAEYTKWLQQMLNKKLCILELGVGLTYPSVIRFPFEKIVFYNRKAFMYRIHPSLYQLENKIKDRGCAVKKDPVSFLAGSA